jgi:hypothetical protein
VAEHDGVKVLLYTALAGIPEHEIDWLAGVTVWLTLPELPLWFASPE